MSETTNRENREENIPKIVAEKLTALRTKFTDEIPQEALHSLSKDSWFTPVVAYLDIGISLGEIFDSQIKEKIIGFTKHCASKKFRQQKLTTKEDIERANLIIDLYLQNCKTK